MIVVLIALVAACLVTAMPPPSGLRPQLSCGTYYMMSNYCTNQSTSNATELIDMMNGCQYEYRAVYTDPSKPSVLTFPVLDGKKFRLSEIWDLDYIMVPVNPAPGNTLGANMVLTFRRDQDDGLPVLLRGSRQDLYEDQPIDCQLCLYFEYLGNAGIRPDPQAEHTNAFFDDKNIPQGT